VAKLHTCANHPGRRVHAVCMTCHRALCQECVTTWDDIHYCAACLARRRDAARVRTPWISWLAQLVAIAALVYACLHVLVWTGVLAAGLL
jgi:hypothetical protein